MLHARLEMELGTRRKRLSRKRLVVCAARQDDACAFLYFEPFIFLLVSFQRKVSAFADDEILLHARMLVNSDDHATPWSLNNSRFAAIYLFQQVIEKR